MLPGLRALSVRLFVLCSLTLPTPASAVKIDFDAPADGTVIDNYYFDGLVTSVSFSNPIGGSIYARASSANTSPGNVVSVLQTGGPQFNAFYGAVDASFNVVLLDQILEVTVKAAAVATGEPLGTPLNKPFMQAFDAGDNLLATVYFQGALPTNPFQVTPFERLTITIPPCVGTPLQCAGYGIYKVRLSSQQTQGGPPIYALFDDLEWSPPKCGAATVSNGDGSSCTGTYYGDSCTTWTCDVGYAPQGSDPVCSSGAWTGSFSCQALPSVPLLPGLGRWLLVALVALPGVIALGREGAQRRRAARGS